MTIFVALFFTIPISFAVSTALVAATSRSLHAALVDNAESAESVAYWVPFSIAITYLVPLFVGLVVGGFDLYRAHGAVVPRLREHRRACHGPGIALWAARGASCRSRRSAAIPDDDRRKFCAVDKCPD